MGNVPVKAKTVYYRKKPFVQVINQAKPGPHYEFDRENTLPTMYVYTSPKRGEITRIFCPTMSYHDAVLFVRSTLRGFEIEKEARHHRHYRRRRHRHRSSNKSRHTELNKN